MYATATTTPKEWLISNKCPNQLAVCEQQEHYRSTQCVSNSNENVIKQCRNNSNKHTVQNNVLATSTEIGSMLATTTEYNCPRVG